ncbi:MAG: hypothetical protein DRI24_12035 [Deltaproteobacteria bacterium]|nr:MAG: hypothetical protein DRI24_12035 [Deltaproteobacteria bacterium]
MTMPKREYGLIFALILFFWLLMDFISLWLSVLCTYFYFGWEGTSFHLAKISLVVLMASSGSLIYKIGFQKQDNRWGVKLFLGIQFLLYLLLAFIRSSDFFAWTTVLGNVVSGMTAVALFRRFRTFDNHETPFYGVLIGFAIYLAVRILNDGLLTLFHMGRISTLVLFGLFVLAMVLKHPDLDGPVHNKKAGPAVQCYAVGFGLLLGLCVVLLYNLSLWSSKTPAEPAAVYYGSFYVGTFAGLMLSRQLVARPVGFQFLLATATVGMGFGVYVVLYVPYGVQLGIIAHSLGCFGTTAFWYIHVRRYWFFAVRKPGVLPVLGLIIGAIAFGFPLAYFLLKADPSGFWLPLLLVAAIMAIIEFRYPIVGGKKLSALWICGVCLILAVPILPSLLSLKTFDNARLPRPDSLELTVMTTNIRYGWTDDYRFEPKKHLQWLQRRPADIVGYQEFNKGSLYGSFMDLYQYYCSAMPGNSVYGDASYGFGNGLFTRLNIKDSRVLPYRSSDMMQRSFVWTLLDFNDMEIEVYVTHVSHLPHPNKIRQAQVAELIDCIGRSKRPWILMGDLNAQPHEPEIVELLKVSNPVFTQKPELLKALSHDSLEPTMRIDYIFFSEHFELIEQKVLDNQGTSDHRPVLARLKLNRAVLEK